MNIGKTLPTTYPTITSWTWHAAVLAILEQYPFAKDWIYSNYIQIHCRPEAKGMDKLFFEFMPGYAAFFECPLLHTQYIDRGMLRDMWPSAREFLVYCIDHGCYIYGVCNEKWLLKAESDFFHELFIYGYDLDKNEVKTADFTFTGTGKYSFRNFAIEDVCRALDDVPSDKDYLLRGEGGIILCKPVERMENKYCLNGSYVGRCLEEYLNGTNSLSNFKAFYCTEAMGQYFSGNKLPYLSFGMDVYEVLQNYICDLGEIRNVDLRAFHNLYEHKQMMKKRMLYLMEKKYIEYDQDKIFLHEVLEKQCRMITNILIKGQMKGDFSVIEKVVKLLREVEDNERRVLQDTIHQLL